MIELIYSYDGNTVMLKTRTTSATICKGKNALAFFERNSKEFLYCGTIYEDDNPENEISGLVAYSPCE